MHSVNDWLNGQRAMTPVHSQWLSGEQVRLCSGHPKVHFGTIVEGSLAGGGEGGGCTGDPAGSLTISKCMSSF